jgi:hypothetical protein
MIVAIDEPSQTPTKDTETHFRFTLLEDAKFSGFEDKEVEQLLFKWYIY